jgi:epidermal growth factor receptor substrate 15
MVLPCGSRKSYLVGAFERWREADFRALADTHNRGALDITEFTIAMHLVQSLMTNQITTVPTSLPPELISAAGIGSPISAQFGQNGVRRTPSMSSTGSGRLPPQLPPKIQQSPLTADFTGGSQASSFEGWDVTPQDKMQFDNLFQGIDKSNKGYIDGIHKSWDIK